MKKHSKAIAAVLAALMCLSVCVFSVYAEGEEDYQQSGNESEQQSFNPDQSSDVPYVPEVPDQSSDYSQSEVPYIPEDNNESSYYSSDTDTNYQSSEYSYDNSNDSVYYDGDGNSYSNQDEVYVGGGQSYQPPVSTAPPAALYETNNKIDVNELSKKDWGDIANLLKNTGSSESDGDDFAFIQKNTSKVDNGHWIIIVGIICILLSVTGFIYLIASGIHRRKMIKAGNIGKNSAQQPRYGEPQRANDDYDDGFKSSSKKSKQNSRSKGSANRYSENGKSGRSGKGGTRYR